MGDERIVVIVADDERILYAGRRPAYTLVAVRRVRWAPPSVYAGRRRAYTLVAVRRIRWSPSSVYAGRRQTITTLYIPQ